MVAESGPWVVDASVAFAWFVAVPGSEQAARLLDAGPATLRLAPDLVLVELLNAGWKSLRLGAITSEQFQVLANRAAEQERATLITSDQRLLRKHQQPLSGLPAALDLACLTD